MGLRYDSYCGLNCGACPVGMANEAGDADVLKELAERWGMDVRELECAGCKSPVTAVFCSECRIRSCARERGLEFCFQCAEYPCDRLVSFSDDDAPHHSVVLKNLSRIREAGLRKWLQEQSERWSCEVCGRRFGWYSETCPGCGSVLYNSVLEERDLES
ncbi:MAG: hypothetical protein AVO35_05810 [Candidatus Aegiribacteria sp. MLS_C]|nr:MAG: hypothetical protein AVO35_05810 [Candidatus Aegiribacteria sp. MLS_C]